IEAVLEASPDLIVDFGCVRDSYISLAERVQAQTAIPYVLIDGRYDNTTGERRMLSATLGVADKSERLATAVEATFARLDAALADIPVRARPRVYLARGPDGLETGLKGSINTEIIERAGGRNVADPGDGRRGLVQVSMEQVIAANPDIIVTWDRNFYHQVWTDSLWAGIAAVRDGRVYLSPTAP